MPADREGVIFNIQRFCLHDGPGIRTTVFLKGCPLRCQWCDNPESFRPAPQLGFAKASCSRCGKCLEVCPEEAIILDIDGMPRIDRVPCTVCGNCVAVCTPGALALYGKICSVVEVFQEVRKDEMFYGNGGGITVSGGEPLRQSTFVSDLFRLCQEAGISTALETCGLGSPVAFEHVLKLTNVVMFDLKHLDPQQHQNLTSKPNTVILDNARLAVRSGVRVQFRMPLVPGLNSSDENIRMTVEFIRGLQGDKASIELMPYHRLGMGKYQSLDIVYPLDGLESAKPEQVECTKQAFEKLGIQCLVSI